MTTPYGSQPAAPAGWYPDAIGGGQRYWDGTSWTAPAPASTYGTPPPGYSTPPPSGSTWGAAPAQPPAAGYPQPGYQQPGYAPVPYPQTYAGMKSPGIAMLLSFFFPGAGHLYVEGGTQRAILFLIGTVVSLLLALVVIGVLLIIGLVVWAMIDSNCACKQWNVAHGFPPG